MSNQYGLPGRAARNWGSDTLEGNLSDEELRANREDQTINTATHRFRDEEYYMTKDFKLEDIEVPLLSVANWVCIRARLKVQINNQAGRNPPPSAWKRRRLYASRVKV